MNTFVFSNLVSLEVDVKLLIELSKWEGNLVLSTGL